MMNGYSLAKVQSIYIIRLAILLIDNILYIFQLSTYRYKSMMAIFHNHYREVIMIVHYCYDYIKYSIITLQ